MKKSILFVLFCLVVIISSAQVSKDVTITAGGLSAALTTGEKATVTNLTVRGYIDARDFKTMRDDMPVLSVVNLVFALVSSYSGTDGTYSPNDWTYPVNEIPLFAFHYWNTAKGKTTLTNVVIPPGITKIGQSAFNGCSGISNFGGINETLTTISSWAFARCGNKLSVSIPHTVSTIGNFAFEVFNGSIYVGSTSLYYSSEDGVLFNKAKTTLIQCPASKTGYIIPSTVTTIGINAFSNCKALTGSFKISSGVKTIGSYAFRNCENLTSLIIPASVDSIGNGAFNECYDLESIYTYDERPINLNFSTFVFYLIDKDNCTLYVPFQTKSMYQSASGWSDFITIEEMSTECIAVHDFPYAEDFSSGALPYCWSIEDHIGNGQVWVFNNPGSRVVDTPTAANGFAIIDSDHFGVGNTQNSDLITNPFDFTYFTNIDLGFSYYYRHFNSSGSFSYSINNGNSWVDVLTLTSNSPNPEYYSDDMLVDLEGQLAGQSNVLFKWNFQGANSWYWAVDDFWITADRIPVEEDIYVSDTIVDSSKEACFNAFNTITVAGDGSAVTIENGATTNFIAGYSIQFMDGFHAESGSQLSAYITPTNNFCYETVMPIVAIVPEEKSIDAPEKTVMDNGEKTIKVYPNPNNGKFNIELKNFENCTITLFNTLGAKIMHLPNRKSGLYPLELSNLSKGLYIIKIDDGNKQYAKKIIIQ
jgi:hypothetical protein